MKGIEKIVEAGFFIIIDSVEDGRLCGSIEGGTSSFMFGSSTKSIGAERVQYPTLEQYIQAFPGLDSWGASGVAFLTDGVPYAVGAKGKKPFLDFLNPKKP